MKLLLVRHGETDLNAAGILQGHGHYCLNEKGKEQARKLGIRLQNENIDVAYISDLHRAKETAAEILKFHPKTKVIFTKELRERHHGVFEGKHGSEMLAAREKAGKSYEEFLPEGGESFLQCQKRTVRFYESLVVRHHAETILLVTHGALLRCLLLHIAQQPFDVNNYDTYQAKNCSLTIVEVDGQTSHITLMNCVKHLEMPQPSRKL